MTIMVDEIRRWPTDLRVFKAGSCHLTTEGPLDELHVFAARIGMRREWFQDHPLAPHYDLTIDLREVALANGAVFVSARDQVRLRRAARGRASTPAARE
jgi:hypothetical protein